MGLLKHLDIPDNLPRTHYLTVIASLSVTLILSVVDLLRGILGYSPKEMTYHPMKLSTAILFLLALAVLILILLKQNRNIRYLYRSIWFCLMLVPTYIFFEHVYRIFTGNWSYLSTYQPFSTILDEDYRLAILSSIAFILSGCILLLLQLKKRNAAHALNIPLLALVYYFVFVYVLGINPGSDFVPISVNTSLAMSGLCVGIFMLYPKTWLLKVFTSGNMGSILARQLLIPVIIIPIIIGWFSITGVRNSLFFSETGVVFVALLYTICLGSLIWISARSINKIDVKRLISEENNVRTNERLRILSSTASRLLASENPQAIVNEICNQVKDFLNCELFLNFLVDPDTNRLHLNAYAGISEDKASELSFLDFGSAICGCVARDGEKIISECIQSSDDDRTFIVKGLGMRAYACHPLMSKNKVIGTLSFGTSNRDHFNNDDLSLMKIVADQVAIAMGRLLNEKALRESETRFRTIAESLTIPIGIVRISDSRVIFTNEAYEQTFGYSSGELLGRKAVDFYVNPIDRENLMEILKRQGFINNFEARVKKNTGDPFWILASIRRIVYEGEPAHISAMIDIDQMKRAQKEMLHLNQILNAMGRNSQAILHSSDELEYLRKVCRILVDDCGYIMVWIGFVNNDEAQTVEPVAYHGFDDDYISKMMISLADEARGGGPTGTAIKTGKPAICRNMLTDPAFEPWREEAAKRGYNSSIVLPIIADEKVICAISIYSKEAETFGPEDVKLLTNLADDIAYGIVHIRLTVSERIAANAIRESEEKYRQLFDQMTEGFALHEMLTDDKGKPHDYRFISINPAFERQTGLKAEDVIGRTARQILPHIEEHWLRNYGDVAFSGKSIEFENYASDLNAYFRVSAFCPRKGYFAAIFENITERIHAENELRSAKEKLDLALENANIGIWTWDIRYNKLECDDRILNMFNIQRDQFIGFDDFERCIFEEDIPHFNRAVNKALREDKSLDTIFRIRLNSGNFNYIDAKAKVEKDSQGQPIKMTGVCLDITAMQMATELTLVNLNEDLLRSNKELEEFAYVASHDLQEPLRMVSSFTQLLAVRYEDKLDAQAKEFIEFAVDGARRMQLLINDLLEYSRIKTRGKPPSLIDLGNVLKQTLYNLNIKILEKSAVITADPLPLVNADEAQMIQLFQNLIDNAMKFCTQRPVIHISVSDSPDYYNVGIKDNGIGIEPQYYDRIFQIFQRLHLRDEYNGTGIGLAICKRIVERHGGRIWVESQNGNGTLFQFTLPKT